MLKRLGFTALVGLVTGFAAPSVQAAPGFIYVCEMTGMKRNQGWISPTVALILPGDGTVTVADAVTLHFAKKPVEGKILRDNGNKLIVKWTVKGAQADAGQRFSNFDYRAIVVKKTGRIDMTAQARSIDFRLFSKGKCEKRTK